MAKTARGPDNSVRLAISGTIATKPWANVMHCQLSTTSSILQSDFDSWVQNFSNQYKQSFATRQNAIVTYSLTKATLMVPGGLVMASQFGMTGTGAGAGAAVSDNSCCKTISWTTNVYWRGGKPRTYLPGVANSDVLNGSSLVAAEISALQTAANGFRAAVNSLVQGTITQTQFGFVSFSSGSVPLNPGIFHPILGATVHARLGSQRRRLGRWTP